MLSTSKYFASLLPALFFVVALALPAAQQAQAEPKCAAAGYVKSAGEAYDRAARTGTYQAFATAVARYTDVRGLSFFALGRYRKELPKARESEYLTLTRRFIGEFMLEYGKGFAASDLTITDCKTSSGNFVVNAKLSSGGRVTFRVAKSGGGYTVKDMNIKGIWLAQQMRSAFVGTMSRDNGGIDALFKYLKS